VTVDFSPLTKTDIYTGLRLSILVLVVVAIGLITDHISESALVMLGTALVLGVELIRVAIFKDTAHRTRVMLSVSVLYASIYAIGVVISTSEYFVAVLLGIGLFIVSYSYVYPKARLYGYLASMIFVASIGLTGSSSVTPALAVPSFLLILAGGLWAIIGGKIFPLRILSSVVNEGAVQEQHVNTKVTWRYRIKPLTDNLSIHSQNFQYALVVAITASIGMIISQWYELHEGIWIVVTINAVLNRNYHEISTSWTVWKVVHRIIGTIIGAVIALIIIDNIQDIWLISFLLFIFMTIYLIFIRIKNYAFTVIFMTTSILLFIDIVDQSASSLTPLERIANIFIGSILCLIASILWRSSSLRKSSPLLRNKTE
jgi:hypothetical protein